MLSLLSNLQQAAAARGFDPETDAPPAGHFTYYNHKDLFIAAFIVPVVLCLLWQLATSLFKGNSSKPHKRTAARRQTPTTPDSSSGHRQRLSRPRPASAAAAAAALRRAQQQQQPKPPPLQTYQDFLQPTQAHHFTTNGYHYNMDPPQQPLTSPQTDRPFRRTQASRRPPSPQSERPFRVAHSQRVYATPGSEGAHSPHSPHSPHSGSPHSSGLHSVRDTPVTAARAQAHTPLSQQTDRPFRVSRQQQATPASNRAPSRSTPAAQARVSASPATTDAPFRFRNSEELWQQQQQQQQANGTPAANGASFDAPLLFTSPPASQQQQQRSPVQGWRVQQVPMHHHHQQQQQQQQQMSPVYGLPRHDLGDDIESQDEEEEEVEEHMPHLEEPHSWDPAMLQRCQLYERFISSVDGLQASPLYRQHITEARQWQLTYETKEKHKLNVYKALRRVDPESFKQLFSRSDVLEYDEEPLTLFGAVREGILTSAFTFTLLGLPLWMPAWSPLQVIFACVWLVLSIWWAVWKCGCTSFPARLLGVYASQGPYSMRPSVLRLLAAVAVETALVVCIPIVGALISLAFRLLTQQRQSAGEWVCRLQSMRLVVRPMHFSPYSPARGAAGAIQTDSEDEY